MNTTKLEAFVDRMIVTTESNRGKPIGSGFSIDKMNHPYSYQGIVVFGGLPQAEKPHGSGTAWSDRLITQNMEKYNEACWFVWGNEAQAFYNRSADSISHFLSRYFERRVSVYKITEGCDQNTGYPVWCFQYVYLEPEKEKSA